MSVPGFHCLASATSATTCVLARSEYLLACGAMFTLCAHVVDGRVALTLLPAYAVRAFCNLLIGTKMRART